MNGFPLPRTGRQLSAAKYVLFFPFSACFSQNKSVSSKQHPTCRICDCRLDCLFLIIPPRFRFVKWIFKISFDSSGTGQNPL